MPPNNLAGEKDVHLPFIEGQPLHQMPPYAWKHWLGLVAAGLLLLSLPVGCCWQTLTHHVRFGAAAPPMISCLGCAGNLCCECYGLLSPLGLGAWVAQAALDFGA